MSNMIRKNDIRYILHFFDRPTEPCFMPKGYSKDVFFDVPDNYIPEAYKQNYAAVKRKRETLSKYFLVDVPMLPDSFQLDQNELLKLDLHSNFTYFIGTHAEVASYVILKLLDVELKYLISASVKILLSNGNPHMFQYALSVVITHRPDTRHLRLPNNASMFPEFYFPHDVLQQAQDLGGLIREPYNPEYVPVRPTATDMYIENRIAYFREDVGLNLHHWHWHIVYPYIVKNVSTEKAMKIVNKDRRGELFYYMHQQIIARYNAERLSNKLSRVISYQNFREPILEPYFPKLTNRTSKNWASRQEHACLKDVKREVEHTLLEAELWRSRIYDAIHLGQVYNKEGKMVPLDETTGIDVLGNLVESSILSTNPDYYGTLHNVGHMLISYVHDPDSRYLESVAVMGDNRTACRDPIFYRWHGFINDIFMEYQKKLSPYDAKQLSFDGIEVTNVNAFTLPDSKLGVNEELRNKFVTYMQKDKLNLSYGIYIDTPGPIYVLFPHLQHREFYYEIKIKNNNGVKKFGTVRIFLAPRMDEDNKPIPLADQRSMYIEMDRFVVELEPNVTRVVRRSSKESTVTIPFKQLFADVNEIMVLQQDIDEAKREGGDQQKLIELESKKSQEAYCSCGWPAHLLIPKGKGKGAEYDLFVMVTDYEEDKVEDASTNGQCSMKSASTTQNALPFSYCGLKNKKYPDSKAMGFPFNRPPTAATIEDFVNLSSNMRLQKVKIFFKDITLDGDTLGDTPTDKLSLKE